MACRLPSLVSDARSSRAEQPTLDLRNLGIIVSGDVSIDPSTNIVAGYGDYVCYRGRPALALDCRRDAGLEAVARGQGPLSMRRVGGTFGKRCGEPTRDMRTGRSVR